MVKKGKGRSNGKGIKGKENKRKKVKEKSNKEKMVRNNERKQSERKRKKEVKKIGKLMPHSSPSPLWSIRKRRPPSPSPISRSTYRHSRPSLPPTRFPNSPSNLQAQSCQDVPDHYQPSSTHDCCSIAASE